MSYIANCALFTDHLVTVVTLAVSADIFIQDVRRINALTVA